MKIADFAELKSHPFFNGIDWAKVAERIDPPFAPSKIEINDADRMDIRTVRKMNVNNELDVAIAEELRGKFDEMNQRKSNEIHLILN